VRTVMMHSLSVALHTSGRKHKGRVGPFVGGVALDLHGCIGQGRYDVVFSLSAPVNMTASSWNVCANPSFAAFRSHHADRRGSVAGRGGIVEVLKE
jgi:hypothetical protein